jgi:PDZ domain-containing protein
LLLLPLSAVTFSLMPVNNGLEAPGFAVSVEPMVQLPEEYRYPSTGSFVLTTVISHAPILAGEWAYTYLDSSVRLKPQDQIVPPDKTIQSVADENYQKLLRSETIAVIVGLRLVGYSVDIEYDGATVVSILSQSPAAGILQIGDIITSINGKSVMSPSDLTSQLKLQEQGVILELQVERDGKTLEANVLPMEPVQPGEPVWIGISVVQHNTGLNLPFRVEIIPQKVRGGPSAGLMFTLGVYNLVTPQDLTGGRKIAGTGTIDLNGEIGTVGGIRQKVVAAERSGAVYFLSPPGNYSGALAAAKHITVIQVATAQEAIDFLQGLPLLNND